MEGGSRAEIFLEVSDGRAPCFCTLSMGEAPATSKSEENGEPRFFEAGRG